MSNQSPKTLFDKIWDDHLVKERSDGTSLLYIDKHLVHEVTSPQAFEGLKLANRKVRRPQATVATADHNVPTINRENISDEQSRIQVETLAKNTKENTINGIYLSFGLGFLQHKINIETKNQYIPQLSNEYKQGYDQLTNGLSTHYNIDYMLIDEKNKFKIFTGINYSLAFTKNRRAYNFSTSSFSENQIRFDQLLGVHFGIIIPINRRNNEEFHYF